MIQNFIFSRQATVTKVIKRKVPLILSRPAMVAAGVLAVVGGDDHLVSRLPPAQDEGGKDAVHMGAGVIHLFAIVEETMAHAVQRAGVKDAVID